MYHHQLDPWPIPKDKEPLYINEPWMIDYTLLELPASSNEPEDQPDNVRIYLPMDLNSKAILRRLDAVIAYFGEASERNESAYTCAVNEIISELEIYDQIWYVRHMPKEGKHSREAVDLAREIILRLADIPDACAEIFPFETIRQLNEEYIGASSENSQNSGNPPFEFWEKAEYRLHLELITDPLYGKGSDLNLNPEEKAELLQFAKAEKGISRDILVPGDITLHALHYAIQRLFGWRNSHLHRFSVSSDEFERLTHNLLGEYEDLCGVLFRFPNDDYSDLYWDDDYTEGTYYRNWLKKKYTAPYHNCCVADTWPDNRSEILDFKKRFPEFKDENSLKSVTEKIEMEDDFNVLIEDLTIQDLLCPVPDEIIDDEKWLADIKDMLEVYEDELEDDTGALARMRSSSSELKYWREARDWLAEIKTMYPNNYKSTARKRFGKSYDEMTAECNEAIPYWTEECSELFNDWVIKPEPRFKELYYQYDYGDDWWIKITVDDAYPVLPREALVRPTCVAADGCDLVDDCGGIDGYLDMLETIHSSDKEEAKAMRGWAKGMGWTGIKRTPDKML